MKVLGVLGGMGPAATIDFLAKLQDATPATRDEDHVRVVMDLNPRGPNRHLETDASGEELGRMAVALKTAGAEVLAMPCNTAHVNRAAIEQASGLELIDMLDAAVTAAREEGARAIGVLSTPLPKAFAAFHADDIPEPVYDLEAAKAEVAQSKYAGAPIPIHVVFS